MSSAVLATLALAAGCGGDESTDSADGSRTCCGSRSAPSRQTLDPGLITDVVSANIALDLMDPLVRLNDELEPEAALAESWDVSEDGTTVTFHLRDDGQWTNGEPVTATDFEYAWKRILEPELAAGYARVDVQLRRRRLRDATEALNAARHASIMALSTRGRNA